MASRRADSKMGGSRKKQEDKHLKILRDLVAQSQNKKCFDCGQRGPTYVNMTIGAFVCTSCSGLLRGMNPPHRIKSISMASFSPQEMEFLESHGNEVCRNTWLALWESSAAPEPESREEQKVKDFLTKKYERKLWYSSKPKASQSQPEAKPLKTLLGENAPQVVVSSRQEQKAASIKPPQGMSVPVQQPQAVQQQPKQERKSNMDLLGDLGGDFFASSAAPAAPVSNTGAMDAFGMFAQPPPAQNQQPLFDAFGTNTSQQPVAATAASSGSFDFFASSSSSAAATSTSTGTDFFAMSSTASQPASTLSSTSNNAGLSGADKYAAFSELGGGAQTSVFDSQSSIFGSNNTPGNNYSGTQSVFSGNNNSINTTNTSQQNNIFGSQQQQLFASSQQQQPQPQSTHNPFMVSSNQTVQPQQHQPQKPSNPFQNFSSSSGSTNMSQSSQLDSFGSSAVASSQQNNTWNSSGANNQQAFSNSMFPSSQTSASPFNMQSGMAQQSSTQSIYSNNTNFTQQPQQQNFGVNNLQQQQQPNNQANMFGAAQGFPQQQQMNGFPPQQQQPFGNFGNQQQQPQQRVSASQQKPFGGIQMPGFGQFPQQQQQQQQQQSFGSWGQQAFPPQQQQQQQQQQQPQIRSNNPFM